MTQTVTRPQGSQGSSGAGSSGAGSSGVQVSQGVSGSVWVGVDAHRDQHVAALIDDRGRTIAVREFAVTVEGYRQLLAWAAAAGEVVGAGVESTGCYAAGLARVMLAAGWRVVEVNTPDRYARARHGKSDQADAVSAAHAVRDGRAVGVPKDTTGAVESLRMINVARNSAVQGRTKAMSQLRDLIITAPEHLRAQLDASTTRARIAKCRALPDLAVGTGTGRGRMGDSIGDPAVACARVLRGLADRIHALDAEIAGYDRDLDRLTETIAPTLRALPSVGPVTAAQMLITVGQNPDRFDRGEASVARLCGVAPIPASSGKTQRWRLSRHGDRAANSALYMIVVGRLGRHQPSRAYAARRTAEGKSKPEIIRCLKRFLIREIVRAINTDLHPLTT